MQARTQNDLVTANLLNQEAGREVTEKVEVVGLDNFFNKPPTFFASKNVKTKITPKVTPLRLPHMKILHEKTRAEVASVLLASLDQRGVIGFEWKVGEDSLSVSSLEGFQQKILSDPERDQLSQILTNTLKSRRNIVGVKWDFGRTFLEITYIF